MALAGLLLLPLVIVMQVQGLEMPQLAPACGFVKPILCAEFPVDGPWFAQVLAPSVNPSSAWATVVWLDYPLLLGYSSLLALGALALASSATRTVGKVAAVCFVAGALTDGVENAGILMALAQVDAGSVPTDGLAAMTRTVAAIKFGLLGAGGLAVVWLAIKANTHWASRGMHALGGLVAAAGLFGAAMPALWELGAAGITWLCLTVWVGALARGISARRSSSAG